MGYADRPFARRATLPHELQRALVGTALQLGDALRRLRCHRRSCGYDYSCSRLLDEVRLSRSLLVVLAEECVREVREPAKELPQLRAGM